MDPWVKRKSRKRGGGRDADKDVRANDNDRREVRWQREFEKAQQMKTSDLQRELRERGVDCSAFFEKRSLAEAYATAVVDGVSGHNQNSDSFDPSYRDVMMRKFDKRSLGIGEKVIDIDIQP